MLFSPITLCSIVRLAKHFAVLYVCVATLTPSRYVVGIHVGKSPDLRLVGVMANGAVRTV